VPPHILTSRQPSQACTCCGCFWLLVFVHPELATRPAIERAAFLDHCTSSNRCLRTKHTLALVPMSRTRLGTIAAGMDCLRMLRFGTRCPRQGLKPVYARRAMRDDPTLQRADQLVSEIVIRCRRHAKDVSSLCRKPVRELLLVAQLQTWLYAHASRLLSQRNCQLLRSMKRSVHQATLDPAQPSRRQMLPHSPSAKAS